MQVAIVGLAGSGKTTVFNTLTRGHAETGGYGGMTVNVGVVKVPDARLTTLTALFKPKREVPADVTYVDLPAPPRDRGRHGQRHARRPAGPPAQRGRAAPRRARVRGPGGAASRRAASTPGATSSSWTSSSTLADLGVVEKRLEKLQTSGRHGTPAEREANEREAAVLERIVPGLTAGRPIRDLELDDDAAKAVRGFRFLTEKPVLVLVNVGEGDLADVEARVATIRDRYDHRQSMVEALSARIEMEIGELDDEAAVVFREELGLAESSLDRVIRLSYRLLGLISFFTAGPDETRAWTIRDGETSVDAAAAIHTDLARGFIRAEVVACEDLLELGSMAEARRHGRLRSEGKTYRVKDGDVIEILFNV